MDNPKNTFTYRWSILGGKRCDCFQNDHYKGNLPSWIYHGYSIQRVQFNPSLRPPIVRHLTFENVHGDVSNELGFRLEGESTLPIQDVHLIHVTAGGRENRITYCENLMITEGEKR